MIGYIISQTDGDLISKIANESMSYVQSIKDELIPSRQREKKKIMD